MSAWGASFGSAWGVSWGATTPATTTSTGGGGKGFHRYGIPTYKKKRFHQTLAEMIDADVAEKLVAMTRPPVAEVKAAPVPVAKPIEPITRAERRELYRKLNLLRDDEELLLHE